MCSETLPRFRFNPIQVAIGQGPFVKVEFLDTYFIALVKDSQNFITSDPEDGTTWNNPANSYQVSVFAENTPGMIVNQRELWLFGNKRTVVYSSTTDPLTVFQPIPGAFIEEGIDAPDSLTRLDNSIFWLAKDERGRVIGRRANGWTPVRVSNHAVETIWENYSTTSDAVGYAWQMNGHIFWQLWFPTADATWVYDAATGQWHQRTFRPLAGPSAQAHRSRSFMFAFNKMLLGDRSTGAIYWQTQPVFQGGLWLNSADQVDGATNNIERKRRAPMVSKEQQWAFHTQIQIYLETGLANTSGAGSNPIVSLRYSDDGGHTWSNEQFAASGKIGAYRTRVVFRRKGRSRGRIYELNLHRPDTVANCQRISSGTPVSYNRVTFGIFRTALTDQGQMISEIWSRWFGTSVVPALNNTTPLTIPGPYVNDAAAAAGGVPVSAAYFKSDGSMTARLT